MSSETYRPAPVRARVATAADLDGLTETMAPAFYEDPVWNWAFAVPEHGTEPLRAAWRFLLESALDYDWVWCSEGYAAAALWIPPGKSEIKPEEEESFESLVRERLGDAAARVFETWERFDRGP